MEKVKVERIDTNENNFNGINYKVKESDTLEGIISKFIDYYEYPKEYLNILNNNSNISIKKGDIINFDLQDNNSASLLVNSHEYIINLDGRIIDTMEEKKGELNEIHQAIIERINYRDENIEKAYKYLDLLYKEGEVGYILDSLNYGLKLLHSPKYKDNPEAKILIKVIENIVFLDPTLKPKDAFEKISSVLDDKNIPLSLKYKLAKIVRDSYIPGMGNEVGDYYRYDPFKQVELANMLSIKYGNKYEEFSSFIIVPDPEGGYVSTNNF